MEKAYDGRQIVGMDLHRRRSVLVRMTQDGRRLGTSKITNSPQELRKEIARAGKSPQVVLEATYGWYWEQPIQRRHCPSSSRHRAACPGEATQPGRRPARPAATAAPAARSPAAPRAIIANGTRCSNLATASSRNRSRRLRPSAVNPPPCAYRIHPAYRQQQDPSAPRTSPIKDPF
jgi:hypothetical protein